jgi:hypothetical protein
MNAMDSKAETYMNLLWTMMVKKTVIENGWAINDRQNTSQCRISLQVSPPDWWWLLLACYKYVLSWLRECKKYWLTKLQMFSFFVTYAEMCSECEIDGSILPSIKSFQMRLKLPKVTLYYMNTSSRQW